MFTAKPYSVSAYNHKNGKLNVYRISVIYRGPVSRAPKRVIKNVQLFLKGQTAVVFYAMNLKVNH